jgi:hypothetical protein
MLKQNQKTCYQKDIKYDMQKPRPQSTQAPSCTTFLHKAFSLFQHHFINTSFDENQYRPEAKIHLDEKI